MEQKLQLKSSRSVVGSRIDRSEEEVAGEVVIGATKVAGDAAKVMSKEKAGDPGARVRGGAEIIHVFGLMPESMQRVERK